MSIKYPNLLSPFKLGNTVFKNRMTAALSEPHFIQGPEPYPADSLITHYANKAKNGAALVTCAGAFTGGPATGGTPGYKDDKGIDAKFDILDPRCQHYLCQLTEAIHFYGSKASMGLNVYVPHEYDVSTGVDSIAPPPPPPKGQPKDDSMSMPREREEIPADLLDKIANDYAEQAVIMKALGFDMVLLLMQYRVTLMARFLSPLTNKRTDQYGGSLENRARFPLMVADRIKQKCGKDFLIEASISGSEPFPGGYTVEDAIEYAKIFAGNIDLLQVRAGDQDASHPTYFNPERTPFLHLAEAIKKSGAEIAVATIGGYLDLGICENVIATGKADFIAMARSWISNPDYGLKAYEDKGEDVVPCIRCNRCHISGMDEPLLSVCSVNPAWGMEHRLEKMISPPKGKKKVAVVGGGLAGMEAALVATERGHEVTLYEKAGTLGGLLNISNFVSFKWPLKAFKNYLVNKIQKSDIKIYLNTEATPELLSQEKYDAILTAVGSEPIVPDISGVDGKNVFFAKDIYGNEAALGENVVIIGGGETGVETGMHLAENGHKVTVLEMTDMLASKSPPVHFYSMFQAAWEKLPNFKHVLNARVNGIRQNEVTYVDVNNIEQKIEADSVVIAVGIAPKNDIAMTFYSSGARFFMAGDCCGAGNVQKTMRSAFSAASVI